MSPTIYRHVGLMNFGTIFPNQLKKISDFTYLPSFCMHALLRQFANWMFFLKKQTQMYGTVFWTLWERERGGGFGRKALKHV